mgnify:CR=1 FL=1
MLAVACCAKCHTDVFHLALSGYLGDEATLARLQGAGQPVSIVAAKQRKVFQRLLELGLHFEKELAGAREVIDAALATTHNVGGKGAVREVCEAILKAQGKWETILEKIKVGNLTPLT